MARRRALISGITGQDGSYLAEYLIGRGYEVHGIVRRSSTFSTDRIEHLYRDPHEPDASLRLHFADLTDADSLRQVLAACDPAEVYNLGAQSHVRVSFDMPIYTADVVALGTLRLLEAVREHEQRKGERIRFFQASSSEMYGNAPEVPQSERTPMRPRSPYAAAKLFAHNLTVNYREAYGMHASCGILFNHESPRRGETFVTRKVTRAAGRIKVGLEQKLFLGNLEARRDWGFAGDYVEAMWRMLQRDEPDDFVIATGETHSVRELVELAFGEVGLDWRRHVEIDPRYFRPTEVDLLCGDASKARRLLGWEPRVRFPELVRLMVASDLELARRERLLRDAGAGRGEEAREAGRAAPPGRRGPGAGEGT